jgi:hypothetical protein
MDDLARWLLAHGNTIRVNPAIHPDWCLDWQALQPRLRDGTVTGNPLSRVAVPGGSLELAEDPLSGDAAWLSEADLPLEHGVLLTGVRRAWPATWENLLRLKDLILEADPDSTVFPSTAGGLTQRSLGVGARFTTMHWPAVEWAMAALDLPMVANQNSIPRELVWDVAAMQAGTLDTVPFPFIGASVPEGHQGQSVQGMSHGAVLSKLRTGFHRRRIAWGFNADHQPVGGRFDVRESGLAAGCVLASSITFDLSPELSAPSPCAPPDAALRARIAARVAAAGVRLDDATLDAELARLWGAMLKMRQRDRAYQAVRARFRHGRAYVRELSIDELPGLTTPATLAVALALCEALDVRADYVAPAFGFQKNFPFADQAELERRVSAAWAVCQAFGCAIGFHSGSGKSAENYQLVGRITGGHLEIKTSGRYTYEFGRALAASDDPTDRALWGDWWAFTRDLALRCAHGGGADEARMARGFIAHALARIGIPDADAVAADATRCRAAVSALPADPDAMIWFEYNFLFVLAAGGRADPAALGDHGPEGYRQRARCYAVSEQTRLAYAKHVAAYLIFLAETTGLAEARVCAAARARLARHQTLAAFVRDIAA